jgi:hypothetical protein
VFSYSSYSNALKIFSIFLDSIGTGSGCMKLGYFSFLSLSSDFMELLAW